MRNEINLYFLLTCVLNTKFLTIFRIYNLINVYYNFINYNKH